MLPYYPYPLQKYPLSILRRWRTHQFRRLRVQLPVAGQECSSHGTDDRRKGSNCRIFPVIGHQYLRDVVVHNLIRIDNDKGKDLFAYQHADHASAHRRQKGVAQIFGRNGEFVIAQRLHGSDRGALLLHHAGHAGKADQRGYQKEDDREHLSYGPHPVGILSVSGELRQRTSVIDEPFGLLDIGNLPFRIADLLLAVFYLGLGFGLAVFIFLLGIFQFRSLSVQLILAIGQRSLLRMEFLPSGINLLLPRLYLGRGLAKLLFAAIQSGLRILKFLLAIA